MDNKKILENFKELITSKDIKGAIKLSDIFKQWTEYCKQTIDKDNIDMDYEGGYITTSFNIEEVGNNWSDYKTYMITFECEEDEELKFEFSIYAWQPTSDSKYTSIYRHICDLRSLKHLNDFEILMMKISEGYKNIILDSDGYSEETFIEYEGEE